MKNLARKILSYDFFLPFAESKRFILVYHDISDEREIHFAPEYYSTTIDNFKQQIRFLSQKFEIIPLEALVIDENLSRNKHYASIVFDDGFLSVVETAQKILSAEQIPFAVFLNKAAIIFDQLWISNMVLHKNDEDYLQTLYGCLTDSSISYKDFVSNPVGIINEYVNFDKTFRGNYLYPKRKTEKRTYLDAEAVKYLHDEGVLVGSHTADHYRLTNCTEGELSSQINENKVFLEDLLKTEIQHFAIPFGKKEHYNKQSIEKIFAHGHKFIYSTNIVPFKTEQTTKTGFLFPRIVLNNHSPEELMFYVNRTFLRTYDL